MFLLARSFPLAGGASLPESCMFVFSLSAPYLAPAGWHWPWDFRPTVPGGSLNSLRMFLELLTSQIDISRGIIHSLVIAPTGTEEGKVQTGKPAALIEDPEFTCLHR